VSAALDGLTAAARALAPTATVEVWRELDKEAWHALARVPATGTTLAHALGTGRAEALARLADDLAFHVRAQIAQAVTALAALDQVPGVAAFVREVEAHGRVGHLYRCEPAYPAGACHACKHPREPHAYVVALAMDDSLTDGTRAVTLYPATEAGVLAFEDELAGSQLDTVDIPFVFRAAGYEVRP
jgi:hypothetical protein